MDREQTQRWREGSDLPKLFMIHTLGLHSGLARALAEGEAAGKRENAAAAVALDSFPSPPDFKRGFLRKEEIWSS